MNARRWPVIVLVLGALLATACRRPAPEVELGVQRIALGLAFSEEELKEPVEPEVIIKLVPAPPEVREPADLARFEVPEDAPPPPTDVQPPCAQAPPGAAPAEPVVLQIVRPPVEGIYERHNTGSIGIVGGVVPIVLPYPPRSTWTVTHAEDSITPGLGGLSEDTAERTWKIHRQVSPTFAITDHLRLTEDELQLLERVTELNGVTTTFTPEPAINQFVFGNEGDTWVSAGVDTDTNTAMVISGEIVTREIVDACGTPIDTYQLSVEEQLVNLETGETSGTNAGEPNIYNIATQHGGLLIREDVKTVSTTQTEDGTPLTIELEYVSLFNGLEPEPLP